MSLEDALNRNAEAVEIQNTLLKQMLEGAGKKAPATAAKSDDGTAKKAAGKKAAAAKTDDDDGDDGVSFAALKASLGAWLGEFKKDEKDPETEARKDALGKQFKKIGIEKLGDAEKDGDKLAALLEWFESKAKKVDRGFGEGRLTEKPSAEDASSEDEDDDDL